MPSILFVCTANRFRSPFAAAVLQHRLAELGASDSWSISSAGTWATPGERALPMALLVARQHGIDLANHRSVRVSEPLLRRQDLILVMQAGHQEALLTEFPELRGRVRMLSEVAEGRSYDISDALDSEQDVSAVLAEIEALMRAGVDAICALARVMGDRRAARDAGNV